VSKERSLKAGVHKRSKKSGNHFKVIDVGKLTRSKLNIEAEGYLNIEAEGNLNIEAEGNLSIEAEGNLNK
jgi:hypothetical protein